LRLVKKLIFNLAVLMPAAVLLGLGTAWYMVQAGTRLSTRTFGPWAAWTGAGRPEAEPYTRAHVALNGLLPVSSTSEIAFRAKADSDGSRLTSGCDYAVVMEDFEPQWWSLAVFDGNGRLVPNPAERHGFMSGAVMREPDGRTLVTVALDARPGNWLPSGRSNRIVLVLTIQDATWAAAIHDGATLKGPLPRIVRTGCR
jgi:hypothetical protein